jgi:Xaa-Pro aminopeptidase
MHAAKVVIVHGSLVEGAVRSGALQTRSTIGFDDSAVTYRQYSDMKRILSSATLKAVPGIIDDVAEVKEDLEIAFLQIAARISDTVMKQLLPLIRPGIRERDLASEITYRHRRLGAERDSFDPIVASGPRTAMPHAKAGSRALRNGDAILLDFGCVVSGYGSDITRTVFLGKPDPRLRKAYGVVRSAQEAALQMVRAGISARAVDAAARNVITRAGFSRNFPHSLGHGIGLEVHERPRVAPSSRETIRAGHVMTIEPGIYLPGTGGVRIEDDVVVHEHECDLLTHSPREMILL